MHYHFSLYLQYPEMLLDLPPELINVIVGYLAPPSILLRLGPCGIQACYCGPQEDDHRQLVLYDLRRISNPHETDVMRFAMAHPYLIECILDGGRQVVVDAVTIFSKKEFGVAPRIPTRFRGLVR
jgi:hypothetical protein